MLQGKPYIIPQSYSCPYSHVYGLKESEMSAPVELLPSLRFLSIERLDGLSQWWMHWWNLYLRDSSVCSSETASYLIMRYLCTPHHEPEADRSKTQLAESLNKLHLNSGQMCKWFAQEAADWVPWEMPVNSCWRQQDCRHWQDQGEEPHR